MSILRRLHVFAALIFIPLVLAACGEPIAGYYDSSGNFVPYNLPPRYSNNVTGYSGYTNNYYPIYADPKITYTTYDQAGFYDQYGNYTVSDGGLSVPQNMLPPAGMCRVWFLGRALANQPKIESCVGIQSRTPAEAFVIYGG